MRMTGLLALAALLAACAPIPGARSAPGRLGAPLISHHQHLISPRSAALSGLPVFDGRALLAQLDEAGIGRAVVLSIAYSYADDRRNLPNARDLVREENDWTASQVDGDRLVGFCSVNPLTDYALAEIERCVRLPNMIGLKLHHGNSAVSLRNPAHVGRLQAVFRLANRLRLPIVLHLRARTTEPWGAEDARIFLNEILPAAPDVVVQVAHLAGAGGYPADVDAAMGVLADAVAAHDPRTRRLFFDITSVATAGTSQAEGATIAHRIRQVGTNRVLFGADLAVGGNPTPAQAWAIFRSKIPLTAAEFAGIAGNSAPYMRQRRRVR
jgi:predicted TIM-barrel fold metal-dependent hydrolase